MHNHRGLTRERGVQRVREGGDAEPSALKTEGGALSLGPQTPLEAGSRKGKEAESPPEPPEEDCSARTLTLTSTVVVNAFFEATEFRLICWC